MTVIYSQQHLERILYQGDLPHECKVSSTYKSIKVIYHIIQIKDKTHVIFSTNIGKAFDRTQNSFTIKTLKKLRQAGNLFNMMGGTYKKPHNLTVKE